MISRNRFRLVTAHLAKLDATGLLDPLHPADGSADRGPKLLGGLIAGHPALNRDHDTLAEIQASYPASMVNQKQADLGFQTDST